MVPGGVVGLMLSASCVLSVGYVNCDVDLAVLFIILGIGLMGLTTSITSGSNQLDLAPPYAGLYLSIFYNHRRTGQFLCNHPLPSDRHHLSCDDCLEDKREDYQKCSVLYCVPQLYTVISTYI